MIYDDFESARWVWRLSPRQFLGLFRSFLSYASQQKEDAIFVLLSICFFVSLLGRHVLLWFLFGHKVCWRGSVHWLLWRVSSLIVWTSSVYCRLPAGFCLWLLFLVQECPAIGHMRRNLSMREIWHHNLRCISSDGRENMLVCNIWSDRGLSVLILITGI